MIDREKVIKGLENTEIILKQAVDRGGEMAVMGAFKCYNHVSDAVALLKEQEAVTIKKTKEHGFGVYGGICPKCRNWIQSAHSFCGFCGQAVKWE